jgi:deoxyribonuclease-4
MSKKPPLLIGAHTSIAGGVQNAIYEGQSIGATTIQLFTANQRQWAAKALSDEAIAAWKQALKETKLSSIMSHDSYLINLGAPDPEILAKSRVAFGQEIERCHALGISFLNFHPGSATVDTVENCLERIVESILGVESLLKKGNTVLLLECTAGQGSSVGHRFEHLASIIQGVNGRVPLGVCLDTCHLFAAGYDIRTPKDWEKTLEEFDSIVGMPYLRAFHLNDSLKGLGSRVDRHQPLGKGQIGWEAFRFLVTHPRTKVLPMYLETPEGPELWKKEIAALREMA